MTILEVAVYYSHKTSKPMTMKIAFSALCAAVLLMNVGCSSSKVAFTHKSNNSATYANTGELAPVAEAPRAATWGGNINPYF